MLTNRHPDSTLAHDRAQMYWNYGAHHSVRAAHLLRDLNALKVLKRHAETARKNEQNPYAALVQLHTTGPWPLLTTRRV